MLSSNSKLNIILVASCVVLVIVTLYLLSYRKNVESINVFFNENDIKNVEWKNDQVSFKTDGKTFTLIKNDEKVFDNEKFDLDVHTGMIIDGRLYLRSVSNSNILIWYDEAEYRLDKSN